MNYGKYDINCCKRCFYLLMCNEFSCIGQGNQLLIIKITMNIIIFCSHQISMYFFIVAFYSVFLNIQLLHFFRFLLKPLLVFIFPCKLAFGGVNSFYFL